MIRKRLRRMFERKSMWAAIYAIYLCLILLSVQAFFAEQSVETIRASMDEKYTYHLTFHHDGVTTHYDVTRHNTDSPGRITLTYWTQDNKLDVTSVSNIKNLKIDVISMFEDESSKVFKKTPAQVPSMYKDYWFEAGDGIFTVDFNIDKSEPMERLTFTKFPQPISVLVNNQEWWTTDLNYEVNGEEITITDIPTGKTTVIIYFKDANQVPIPSFTTTPSQYAGVDEDITFDGSASSDPDGTISSWVWSFGDGGSGSGETVNYKYTTPGVYTVRLTVRDDEIPFAEAWTEKNITVEYGAEEDNDDDGLRDKWEWDNFGSLDHGPGGDFDSDDYSNQEEHDAGTDPNDPESNPGTGTAKKEAPPSETNFLAIAAAVIVVVILLVLFMVFKSKKAAEVKERESDEEKIAEMEKKIAEAKKLGLPTKDLERLLREAKGGKDIGGKGPEGKAGPKKAGPKGGKGGSRGPPKGRNR